MTPSPESVFAPLAALPGSVWLDGGRGSGWSILAWSPVDLVTAGSGWPEAGRALLRPTQADPALPFHGGVIGYLGFGAGHHVDAVPTGIDAPEPEVWLARYEGALCYRHADRTWHPTGTPDVRAAGRALLDAAVPLPPPPSPEHPSAVRTVPRATYQAGVRRILEWIEAGDCYQVNLTRPVFVEGAGDPWSAYRRLRQADAPFGAFLRLDGSFAVLSNSPELFLEVRGQQVRSIPIKGTRPRAEDPHVDAHLAADLRDSAKDRAELTMIVDLVRNDLGRVAAAGTVSTGGRTLTAHPTVHHAAWEVSARLDDAHDAWSALAASFPPGSVTGAPKVRACQRIAELEPHPRGVYCGAIGYVSDTGDATFNVAIRTAIFEGNTARYHVGGGIVAASDPREEWDETVHKGRALRSALIAG
jgi:para-aminobenzoate synthetase component 1